MGDSTKYVLVKEYNYELICVLEYGNLVSKALVNLMVGVDDV